MPAALDLTGQRYDHLTALRRVGTKRHPSGQTRAVWLFRCDCGKEIEKTVRDVRRLDVKSCGCARRGKPANNRMAEGESSFNGLYTTYRYSAKVRGIKWSLDKETFRKLTKQDCYYCGQPPSQEKKTHRLSFGAYVYNGIDRLTPRSGYEPMNVVSCCHACNYAKRTSTAQEFLAWVEQVHAYQAGRISTEPSAP